jgi:TonB-dependent starch-binding outer membrane protein SusC
MKKIIPHFFRVVPQTIALLCLSIAAFAQTAVTGKVTDSKDGSPAVGVTVTVKGTRTATKTGTDGTFTITAAPTATLLFTSVSFNSVEVAVAGKTSLDVRLVQSNQQLNEVVVIGYGTTRKKDLTGVVNVVTSKDFQKGNITTPEQMIAGKVPGVAITSNSLDREVLFVSAEVLL